MSTHIFSYQIAEDGAGQSVMEYLLNEGYSSRLISRLKKPKDGLTVNGQHVCTPYRLASGDLLRVALPPEPPSEKILPVPLPVGLVYEDDDILVVDKPADMPIHPSQGNYTNTLANAIAWHASLQNESYTYRAINRLDRDTTGLLILAKHSLSACLLSHMIKERQIRRTYLAVACGLIPESGTIDAPIARLNGSTIERCIDYEHGERAVTHFRRLNFSGEYSLAELRLETGRTHQIRVHLSHIGHPIPGDFIYYPEYSRIKRQALHSWKLDFIHPITKKAMHFTAPLPDDMASVISFGGGAHAPE